MATSGLRIVAPLSHYRTRMPRAEVLVDAVMQVTQNEQRFKFGVPQPHLVFPSDFRSIKLVRGKSDQGPIAMDAVISPYPYDPWNLTATLKGGPVPADKTQCDLTLTVGKSTKPGAEHKVILRGTMEVAGQKITHITPAITLRIVKPSPASKPTTAN